MECDEDSVSCEAMDRFTDNEDGTVTDNQSEMIWLKNGNCFDWRTWSQALSDSTGLLDGSCGLTDGSNAGDWRLPTSEEWENFVCGEYSNLAVCNTEGSGQWSENDPFSSVQAYYWSGSEYDQAHAWYMDTGNGSIYMIEKSIHLYVWPVRDDTTWLFGVHKNL
jgi:hypothetical protein